MQVTSKTMYTEYVDQSIAWEYELVDYVWRCETHASGDDSLSSIAATLARLEIRRCLQARTLVRRLSELPTEELATALSASGLGDHAGALIHGNWAAVGLAIE